MKEFNKVILIVVDGLGVGAMPDCIEVRPSSVGTNTFLHVVESEQVALPTLNALGMSYFLQETNVIHFAGRRGVGKCALKHEGADSFEGHNEIMGNRPKKIHSQFMADITADVVDALEQEGFIVKKLEDMPVLLVNDAVIVADNMETDPGQVINVTGALDLVSFVSIQDIGRIVRKIAKTNRVIALGGTGIDVGQMLDAIIKQRGAIGLDTPRLNVYNDSYRVQHMGYGIDPEQQIQSILGKAGVPVFLLGKMADVLDGSVTYRKSMAQTSAVLAEISAINTDMRFGFIAATIQETDLFGHMNDSKSYANVLRQLDFFLPSLLEQLNEGNMLIITGDHGNDPTSNYSMHTREYVPLLVYQKGQQEEPLMKLGVRATLSDIAATISDYFGVQAPEAGISCLDIFRDKK